MLYSVTPSLALKQMDQKAQAQTQRLPEKDETQSNGNALNTSTLSNMNRRSRLSRKKSSIAFGMNEQETNSIGASKASDLGS